MRKWTFVIVILAILLGVLYYISFGSYSEGRQGGFVVTLSKKGYVFKTYEGELRVGGFFSDEGGGLNATEWRFSVNTKNKEAIQRLEEAIATGQRVSLVYEEKFFVLPWNGDTKYFITNVEFLRSNQGAAPFPEKPAYPEQQDTLPERQAPADTSIIEL